MSTADGVAFDRLCLAAGLPKPIAEFKFAIVLGRKWSFDWCWPAHMLALEIDGGGFVQGRHHRYAGYAEDCIKLASAVLLGWRVLRFTPQQVADGTALDFLARILKAH